MRDLFETDPPRFDPALRETPTRIAPGAWLLPGRALHAEQDILSALSTIAEAAPFRQMKTPGGHSLSVAMTSCGSLGWVSDAHGYRYQRTDPLSGKPWPAMPDIFTVLAVSAAFDAGYPGFTPDSCLINRYRPGDRLSLHQDRNERDLTHPIVSVSFGLAARFQFGGTRRSDHKCTYRLTHGDIVVWGGPLRLAYHGIMTMQAGDHPRLGPVRINLTFRTAG